MQGCLLCSVALGGTKTEMEELKGKELAIACAEAADELRAEDIVIMDVRGLSSLTDFLVICSGNSMPHLKAVARDIREKVAGRSLVKPFHHEGKASSRWIVLDYIDVMVHVMHGEMRETYDLEQLWGDGKPVAWNGSHVPAETGDVSLED